MKPQPYTLSVGGRLLDLSTPLVMGILNATPDSFYAESRQKGAEAIRQRADQIVEEGGTIIDVGAYSTRPGADPVDEKEEWRRLDEALAVVRRAHPEAIVSVDTFRGEVARRAVETYGAQIINDISGGTLDREMLPTVERLHVPYILTHTRGTPQTMQQLAHYDDLISEMIQELAATLIPLRERGVADVVIDPGFGFAKTLEQNYELLARLEEFDVLGAPLLVGLSRKSMVFKALDCSPQEALNGTTALHAVALMKGAHILRVHDVREAVEAVNLIYECA